MQAPDNTAKFVGKLSFTPHINHQRQRSFSPAGKSSPKASPDQQAASGNKAPVQPPLMSMYAPYEASNATDHSSMTKHLGESGKGHTPFLHKPKGLPGLQANTYFAHLLTCRSTPLEWCWFCCHSCSA